MMVISLPDRIAVPHHLWSAVLIATLVAAGGCAHDIHTERTDAIKQHVKRFYNHLEADRVVAAVQQNERIEGLALEVSETIRRRSRQPSANEVDRDWTFVRTAYDAAARNWLALARYLTLKQRYDQARDTYQRVLDTYGRSGNPADRLYAEQAARGLKDLSLVAP